MSDMMTFPATVEEFMEQYKIVDDEKVYTNGAELVPIFRMMQWFEHFSATDKNVGTTDTISRQQAIDAVTDELDIIDHVPQWVFDRLEKRLKQLPPAQPETATVSVGISKGGVTMWYECDACGEPVDQGDTFCSGCGRKLKHE